MNNGRYGLHFAFHFVAMLVVYIILIVPNDQHLTTLTPYSRSGAKGIVWEWAARGVWVYKYPTLGEI